MTKREEKSPRSTSRGREKAFSKPTGKPTHSSNRHSEAAGHGDKKHFSNDNDRSRPSRNHGEGSSFPRTERPANRYNDQNSGSSERPARRFESRNDNPDNRTFRKREGENSDRRFDGNNSERPARRFDNDNSERPARRFDSREGGERKPYASREGDRGGDRRFGDNNTERPARRFDNDNSERPARRFDSREGGERKPYASREGDRGGDRRFGDNSERPARRFDNDNSERPARRFDSREGGERKPYANRDGGERKPYNNDRDHGYNRDRKPGGDYSSNLKPRRRDINAESEILSEIVANRRETGRLTTNKQQVLSLKWEEENRPIRLNKYISNSGICSRREADKLIESGAILVNDKVITELGTKVFPTDVVRFEDKILNREKPVYIILNKPKDFITTVEDEKGRRNVMELIEGACRERVYPVGRLDRNTTGLLLFTNDGEMAKKLTHPRYGVRKIYQVELDKSLTHSDMQAISEGITVDDDVFIKPNEIAYASSESKRIIGIEIHSGQNRIVRRIFESLGYEVVKLDRTVYAGLTKKELPRGRWRFLTKEEINILKISIT